MAQAPGPAVRVAGSGTATPTGTHGSQTLVQTELGPSTPPRTLRLRAEPGESRRIRWAEDVVDNEGMGKKSSKVCCIYHKPREPGDSDSDTDSDSSDSDNDSEPDLSRAQRPGSGRGRRGENNKEGKANGNDSDKARKPSPNAYERQPRPKNQTGG